MGVSNTYIDLKIKDLEFIDNTENTVSLNNVRSVGDIGSSVVVEIYDESFIVIESALVSSNEFSYRYGTVDKPKGDWFNATITKINPSFSGDGVALTVEGISSSLSKSESVKLEKNKVYRGSQSNIVRQIASEEGWSVGEIVDTVDDGSTYTRININSMSFIKNNLIPTSRSLTGDKGDYVIYTEDRPDNTYVYFKPRDWNSVSDVSFEYYIGSQNEKVISFEPDYSTVLTALIGAGNVIGEAQDSDTNELLSTTINSGSSTIRRVGGNSYSASQLESLSKYVYERASGLIYTATLTLIGDNNIKPSTSIKISVYSREGLMHHTSGIYYVNSVEDVIEGGSFTSILSLQKLGSIQYGVASIGFANNLLQGNSLPILSNSTKKKSLASNSIMSSEIKEKSSKYLGIPYVWGGSTLSGMDCSGFTQYFMKNEYGIDIPRKASNQALAGEEVIYDDKYTNLLPGDLIFKGVPVKHVVMYLGEGKIIHAPSTGDVIKYANLYFTPSAVRRFI